MREPQGGDTAALNFGPRRTRRSGSMCKCTQGKVSRVPVPRISECMRPHACVNASALCAECEKAGRSMPPASNEIRRKKKEQKERQ